MREIESESERDRKGERVRARERGRREEGVSEGRRLLKENKNPTLRMWGTKSKFDLYIYL